MRRSLASHYRIKTAHHLLNIVALKREMDTYSVDGLLKAASTGHSKEACLRYAGLQAALLIEKRAVDFNNLFKAADGETPIPRGGYDSPYFGGSGNYGARPNPIPGLNSTGPGTAPAPRVQGGGVPMAPGGKASLKQQPAPIAKPLGSTAPSNLDRSFLGGIADSQRATKPTGVPGLSIEAPAGPAPAMNAAGTGSLRQAPAPLTAAVIPKPTGYSKPVPNQFSMTPGQQDARIAKNQVDDAAAQQSKKLKAQKPTETVDPVEDEYTKQLNESAAYSAASKQKGDEDAYMKSIEPTAPVAKLSPEPSPVAQEEVAAQSGNNGFQRQQVIGSGAPIRTMIGNMRGRRGR